MRAIRSAFCSSNSSKLIFFSSKSRWISSTRASSCAAVNSSPGGVSRGVSSSSISPRRRARRFSRFAAARAFFARSRWSFSKLVRCAAMLCSFRLGGGAASHWPAARCRCWRRPTYPPARRSRRHECRRLPTRGTPGSDGPDVLGFLALATRSHVELDLLTLFESLVASPLDVGEVNEDVVALLTRDEAVALLVVEELHGSSCH